MALYPVEQSLFLPASWVSVILAVIHLRESAYEGLRVLISSFMVAYILWAATSSTDSTALGEDTLRSCRSIPFLVVQLYSTYFLGSRMTLSNITKHFARAFSCALYRCSYDSLAIAPPGQGSEKFVFLCVPATTLAFHFLLGILFSTTRGFTKSLLHDYRQPSVGSRLQQLPHFITLTFDVSIEVLLTAVVTPILTFTPFIIADIIVPAFLYDHLEITVTAMGFALFVASGAAVFADPIFRRFTAATFSAKRQKEGLLSTLFSGTNLTGGDRDLVLLMMPCVLLVSEAIANTVGMWQDVQLLKRLLIFMWIAVSYAFLGYFNLCGILTLSGEREENITFNVRNLPTRRGSGSGRGSPRWGARGGTEGTSFSSNGHSAVSTPVSKSREQPRRREVKSGGDRSSSGSERGSRGSSMGSRSGLSRKSPSMEIMELSMSPIRQTSASSSSSSEELKENR